MHSVSSDAVANSLESVVTLADEDYTKMNASNCNFVWRTSELCSINIYDSADTGVSIDFDFGTGEIRVYSVVNRTTVGQKTVSLS